MENYKIYAPNKQYTGVSASVQFLNGIGYTADPYLVKWFKTHGYKVEDEQKEAEAELEPEETEYKKENMILKEMKKEELQKLCDEKGIFYNSASTKVELIEKLQEGVDVVVS